MEVLLMVRQPWSIAVNLRIHGIDVNRPKRRELQCRTRRHSRARVATCRPVSPHHCFNTRVAIVLGRKILAPPGRLYQPEPIQSG
jgi:hypothetical protein